MQKKIIFNILIVTVVVFALDFAIGRLLRYFYFKESSGLLYRTTYSIDSTKADLLIFGASRANHHYLPEVFVDSLKKSYYNTGRDGSGTFYQLAILRAILKRYVPKIIVFEYSSSFVKGSTEYDQMSSLLPYYRTHKEMQSLIQLKGPFEKIKLLSEIYPFNSQALTIAVGNLEFNKKRVADNKGYVSLYGEWKDELDSAADKDIFEIDTAKVNAFRECIVTAKTMGVKVFVVYSPIFQKYNRSQELDICNEICLAQKIPFWDFSKDTIFLNNRSLFQDVLHLNNKGAAIFSKIVVRKIMKETKMPD